MLLGQRIAKVSLEGEAFLSIQGRLCIRNKGTICDVSEMVQALAGLDGTETCPVTLELHLWAPVDESELAEDESENKEDEDEPPF